MWGACGRRTGKRPRCAHSSHLCATDPAHFGKLSPASVHTLNLQGGPMSEREVAQFRTNPDLDAIIQVRIWDEGATDPEASTPPFEHYAALLERVVQQHVGKAAGA